MAVGWWVALIVFGYIVGQWWLLRPSAAEHQKMQLRAAALKLGFRVNITKVPEWLKSDQQYPDVLVACYRWSFELSGQVVPNRVKNVAKIAGNRSDSLWQFVSAESKERWQRWCPHLLGVETTDVAVFFYWREDALVQDMDDLQQLAESFGSISLLSSDAAVPAELLIGAED